MFYKIRNLKEEVEGHQICEEKVVSVKLEGRVGHRLISLKVDHCRNMNMNMLQNTVQDLGHNTTEQNRERNTTQHNRTV